jgi:hypothetical protein
MEKLQMRIRNNRCKQANETFPHGPSQQEVQQSLQQNQKQAAMLIANSLFCAERAIELQESQIPKFQSEPDFAAMLPMTLLQTTSEQKR